VYFYKQRHPSSRHSKLDWSRPVDLDKYPKWAKAQAVEVVITPGTVLYIPAYWNHFIVSLNTNIQCNTRSGLPFNMDHDPGQDVVGCIR